MEKSIGAPAAMDLSTGWKLTVNSFFGQDPIVLENVSAMDWADMPELSGISKCVLICIMYAGRIGVLSTALAILANGNSNSSLVKYPEGKIMVG